MTTYAASVTIIDLPVGTTVSGAELFEAVQTVGGVVQSVQLSLSNMLVAGGGLPAINTLVNVGTALATTGTATSIVAFVASGGIGSTQLGALAVQQSNITTAAIGSTQLGALAVQQSNVTTGAIGTAQLASNIGLTGTFSAGGTASFSGGIISTGTFQVIGASQFTGSFGVSDGTATFTTTNFGVIGSTLFTSNAFGVVGTALFTSTFGVVGTTQHTGAFNVVGTSIVTGIVNISGTATFSSGIVTQNATSGLLLASSTGVVSAVGGMVLLNTLSPSAVASTSDTTSLTSAYSNYLITFANIVPATNTTTFQMQIATTGTAFVSGSYVSIAQVNVSSVIVTDVSTTAMLLTGTRATTAMQTSTLYGLNGFIRLFNPSNTVFRKSIVGEISYAGAGASVSTSTLAQAQVNAIFDGNSNAVTGVNFLFSSGNIATGTIRIYGLT